MPFLAKSVKPFRIYRKINVLTLDLGVRIIKPNFFIVFFIVFLWFLHGAIVSKISQAIQNLSQMKYLTYNFDL